MMILKKIAKLLFNRVFYVIFAMAVQLGWLLTIFLRLAGYSRYMSFILDVISILVVLKIVNRKINPSYKLAWTMLILCLPIFGLVLYLVFGRSRIAAYMQDRFNEMLMKSGNLLQTDPEIHDLLEAEDISACNQSDYIYHNAGYPIHGNTTAEYFQVGDDMFPVLVRELEQAQHYIFIEYFIIHDGVMWRTILDILERKVQEGVDVRLIYDDMGCLTTLPHKYYETMRSKGIKCQVFNPFRPILNIIQNNRDHRKFCIIDGYVGFTGGVNLADEYINAEQRFGYWKDAALRVEGDAAWNFTVMFLNFWNAFRPSETDYDAFRPMPLVTPVSDGIVQPYADSPLDEEPMAETVYLNILAQAQRYVYIYTPYLAVGEEMLDALKNAAKRGVDIRLVLPGIPDKKLVFRLSRSYYLPLLRAGVRIYEYTPGFLHAKCWVSDDVTAVVGSINMDYRSLFLHFECGVLLQKNSQVAVLRDDVRATLPQCREIQVTECRTSLPGTVLDSVLRLLSPLM